MKSQCRRRLEVYHQDTTPVIDFYQQRGTLKTIDGDRSMEEVSKQLSEAIS
jgi:adenylate kinase